MPSCNSNLKLKKASQYNVLISLCKDIILSLTLNVIQPVPTEVFVKMESASAVRCTKEIHVKSNQTLMALTLLFCTFSSQQCSQLVLFYSCKKINSMLRSKFINNKDMNNSNRNNMVNQIRTLIKMMDNNIRMVDNMNNIDLLT